MPRNIVVILGFVLFMIAPVSSRAEAINRERTEPGWQKVSLQVQSPLRVAGLEMETPASDDRGSEAAPARASKKADQRVALVIGNGTYANGLTLKNPVHDAREIARVLQEARFATVELATDLTRSTLLETLRSFEVKAKDADWAVIYYAGSGFMVGGESFILPTDVPDRASEKWNSEAEWHEFAVPLGKITSVAAAARNVRVVLFDACGLARYPSGSTGLSNEDQRRDFVQRVEASGVLFSFAAKAGQYALDATDSTPNHSPYAAALIRHLLTPGLDLPKLFRRVSEDVVISTDDRQEPVSYGKVPAEAAIFMDKSSRNFER